MANRRMFSREITESDAFTDMPLSSQALYFHIGMAADDEGFCANARRIQRMVGASDDDLRVLAAKNFIVPFSSGVVVIKHWRMNNYIRADRFKPTAYLEERAMLSIKENGAYTFGAPAISAGQADGIPSGIPSGNQRLTQCRIGKDRIVKDSVGEGRQIPPTLAEIQNYVEERGYSFDAQRFFSYYAATNWRKNGEPINWRAQADYWQSTEASRNAHTTTISSEYDGAW